MTQPRISLYRNALQVSPERIAAISDDQLNDLMTQLLLAEAYRCGCPVSEIRVNTEGKAKDDGSDGWSGEPVRPSDWLGSVGTCWQFKAGSAGEPARLSGEVRKRIPRETLENGGRFVVVASGSSNGLKGEGDRRKKLIDEARAESIPIEKIEVIGSERLTIWCNEHPAVASRWAGPPNGLWSIDDWSNSEEHLAPWHAATTTQSDLGGRRADLDLRTGEVIHLHIQGPPGVGKTRLALELCREAEWRDAVIYIRQAADLRLAELIDSAVDDKGTSLVVVADEVQSEQLRPLRDSAGRGDGRIRLITVGHCPTPDPRRIPALKVAPLARDMMREVVGAWYPAMPPEHVAYVVRFADGYVRLARLAAEVVDRNPEINVHGLLGRDEIRGFLDRMLGEGDRRSLQVVAVLSRIGWSDEIAAEGQAVARHFGLDWNSVRASVEDFHRRFGIAPRGGRYRYISPTPLGVHLAVEAWSTFPDLLKSLPAALPSDGSREAYYERLQAMASNPQAREFARQELDFFRRFSDFLDARDAHRWSALAAANPERAARNALMALAEVDRETRLQLRGDARREIVTSLVRLAWRASTFHDSVRALALLAEAENETWSNNATAEFIARFQIYLGGTAVPFFDRLRVLDELLEQARPASLRLVVKALAQVSDPTASRIESGPATDAAPEPEWGPATGREYQECVTSALDRLARVARIAVRDIQPDVVEAARDLAEMLRAADFRRHVADFFDAVLAAYPDAREPLRRAISDVIVNERKHHRELTPDDLKEVERIHARFEGRTLRDRLQQYVGPALWEQDEAPDISGLAVELLSDPKALAENWEWLTSGGAGDAWRLGEEVGASDTDGTLEGILHRLPGRGPDKRILCGYVDVRRKARGDEWYDAWMNSLVENDPESVDVFVETAWRCGVTPSVAAGLARVLRDGHVNAQLAEQLAFGKWSDSLASGLLQPVLRAMADAGLRTAAMRILERRMHSVPAEADLWKPIALELVTAHDVIRGERMTSYHWKKAAKTLADTFPREIAAAIFREQDDRDAGTWFAEHSQAAGVLRACAETDPVGVWQELLGYLSPPARAYRFSIGFPGDVVTVLPRNLVVDWASEQPAFRAAILAKLTRFDLSSDETVTAQILGRHGDLEDVASAHFAACMSGVWSGNASDHWDELAGELEKAAVRTALPKLGQWAHDAARSLRDMAERGRQREEEDDLRW